MNVYRLSKSIYADDLTGNGARLVGGRWNSKGLPVIYTSSSRALCTVEVAVHIPLGILPQDYRLVTISVPDSLSIQELDNKKLPEKWYEFPYTHQTQTIGDDFIKAAKYAVLKVPSALVQGDYNYLINPTHADIKKVKIKSMESYKWDERLFKR
jgi:RES domain-containing protein